MASETQTSAKILYAVPGFPSLNDSLWFIFFTIWFLIHSLSLQVEVTLNTSSASYYWLYSFGKLNLSSVGDYTSIYSTLRGRNTTQRAWSDWHPYWLSWSTLAPSLSLSIDLFWQSPSFSPLWFQCLNNHICLLVTV